MAATSAGDVCRLAAPGDLALLARVLEAPRGRFLGAIGVAGHVIPASGLLERRGPCESRRRARYRPCASPGREPTPIAAESASRPTSTRIGKPMTIRFMAGATRAIRPSASSTISSTMMTGMARRKPSVKTIPSIVDAEPASDGPIDPAPTGIARYDSASARISDVMTVDRQERDDGEAAVERGNQVVPDAALRIDDRGVGQADLHARQLARQLGSGRQDADRHPEREPNRDFARDDDDQAGEGHRGRARPPAASGSSPGPR